MISNIVNSDGLLVYRGNIVDSKFATVVAMAGHQRVDGDIGDFEYPKWDGANWVEGKTDMQQWQEDIRQSDSTMLPRTLEDLITSNPSLTLNADLKAKYDAKVALRNSKPE